MSQLPPEDLNQTFQYLMHTTGSWEQVTIELHETFGDRNRELVLHRKNVNNLSYYDGVLIVEYKTAMFDNPLTPINVITVLPWDRVRDITFREKAIN